MNPKQEEAPRTTGLKQNGFLTATGRKPNIADIHLENAGVETRDKDGAILVNSQMHTDA